MTRKGPTFNPPPGWPKPPAGWVPPRAWSPDPSWPAPPPGWQLWIEDESDVSRASPVEPVVSVGAVPPADEGLDARITRLEAENAVLRGRLAAVATAPIDMVELDDERVLQAVGVYRYHHPLENAVAYRDRLVELSSRIAALVKSGEAIQMSNAFTFDGSLAKGRSMTKDLSALMLRAYNAEAENVVRTLRAGNVDAALKRLANSRDSIRRLGSIMEMHISDAYHALRVEEIELTADYQMKKEEERETARAERDRLREERKVEMELAAAREQLDKERAHLATVIEKMKESGQTDPDLEQKLAEVDGAITKNEFRAANIRAGYVYVISNRGAFGEHVVKIGLTRRLEPLDRIQELGDASVPFKFDVHAIYFSEDAVKLEAELHEHFNSYRVNWANDRKEFFFATPAEVREILIVKLGNLLEFAEHAEASEYLQSVGNWPPHVRAPSPAM